MEHFLKAMSYSRDGFCFMLRETAFRQELALLALGFAASFAAKGIGALAAVIPWGLLVLIAESLNTGIEKCVDLCTGGEWEQLAKESKDVSSFACGAAITAFVCVCLTQIFL